MSRSLWELLVPTFRIFEDLRGFWLGTCNIHLGCPPKNIWDFTIKNVFTKKKTGHGGTTRNRIPRSTTVTEFSEIFLVFYKWPDLTDVQGIVHGTVSSVRRLFNTVISCLLAINVSTNSWRAWHVIVPAIGRSVSSNSCSHTRERGRVAGMEQSNKHIFGTRDIVN